MKIWQRIRQLSVGQLFKLSVLFLKHPLLILPTLKATKQTFVICDQLYGKAHHKSNAANAFRHALWNMLICLNSLKRTKNKQKSVFWAQKVTDLYEKVTKNNPLDEAMDLHNNAIGRMGFLNNLNKTQTEIVSFFQEMAKNAKKVSNTEEMKKHLRQFFYISE